MAFHFMVSSVLGSFNFTGKKDFKTLLNNKNPSIRIGYEETVSVLIRGGVNVNEMKDGETALHGAAEAGNLFNKPCDHILTASNR